MAQALAFEKVDKHGNPVKHYLDSTSRKPQKAKKPCLDPGMTMELGSSDEDDHDFEGSERSMSHSESDSDSNDTLPSNTEVFYLINLFLDDNN